MQISDLSHEKMAINKNSKKNPKPQTRSHHLHKPHSLAVVTSLFTCKHLQAHLEQPKEQRHRNPKQSIEETNKVSKKMGTEQPLTSSFPNSPSSSIVGSLKGMPFRKLSGCYECRMVVDPVLGLTRDPSLRTTICPCPVCGQIFMKPESLELHQAVRHAVSELGQEDTSRNVVEIIFQSSWHNKHNNPICKIDRILKVHNTPKVISRFEEYRDAIKAKANKKHPRCVADGNELLRFHSTTFVCSLGLNGSSNLCNSIPNCHVCGIIKNGFKVAGKGVLTTATSWTAHVSSAAAGDDGEKRAMLVCRVIAGRVKKNLPGSLEEYDSVTGAGAGGGYGDLEELYVFNPKAVLPCFVVMYSGV